MPVCFAVNEPLLFGTPIVLNPYLFIPFLVAPMVNVCIFKFFVDVLQMNSFMYVIPWSTPAPIGIIMGTGFSLISLLLIVILIVVDALIYLPFLKAYDKDLCEQEAAKAAEIQEEQEEEAEEEKLIEDFKASNDDSVNVLVLCVGAGTSAMLANSLKKGAAAKGLPIDAFAAAYGSHNDILQNYDMVIMSPQVYSHLDEIKADAAKYGIQVVPTKGAQYIALTRDPEGAVDFVLREIKK